MDALLATKFGIQARGAPIVARPRLLAALTAAGAVRLLLLSAPAGFGKSSLLADWARTSEVRTAWLSLDRGDNDPSRFLRYLRAAVVQLRGNPAPVDDTSPQTDTVLADVVQALAESGQPAVLVLDDYQVIESATVHDLVARLLERLPPNARLAIATRADPPLPLSRLRGRGELLELRAANLRFTEDETAAFLVDRMGLHLTADQTLRLTNRTEGWAAALQLAALSLQGRSDPQPLIDAFGTSHRFVLDFVADEVLANLPPETDEFLLRTSVLDRLSGPLCDALTGHSNGAAVLDRLWRANLLLTRLDEEGTWYRYHGLFADLLRARLAARQPELPNALIRLAAEWHEGEGHRDEAIEYALRSGDAALARRLVRIHWGRALHTGEPWTLQRWIDRLPDAVVRADPILSMALGWAIVLQGRVDGVEARIEDAEQALAEVEGVGEFDRQIVPSGLASLRSRLAAMAGDGSAALRHARQALSLVPDGLRPQHEAILRGDATIMIADALMRNGDSTAAAATYRRAIPLLRRGGNLLAAAHAALNVVQIEIGRGNLAGATDAAEEALEGADAAEPTASAPARLAMAQALAARRELGSARTQATLAGELARRGGDSMTVTGSRELLERLDADAAAGLGPRGAAAVAGLAERLTEREIEVLRLVAAGQSNRQIAAELVVALGTVKAHVHSVMGKLGAENRVAAIARARELGLLA